MLHSGFVQASVIPRQLRTDQHVDVVQYDPNNVVLLNGRYGYQTQITFAPNETIQTVSIGDSMAWLAVAVNNNLFIKPIADSKTNMTVLTNVNSYNFQLDSSRTNVPPTYKLQFRYSDNTIEASNTPQQSFDPNQLNWKYSYTGDKTIAPIEAFDNGRFTYFQFKQDGMSHLPAIFTVNKDREEALINYHIEGDYLVVNTVAKQFTLRDGKYVTSVYNDLAIGDWKHIR